MAASRRAVLSVALVIRFTEKVNLGSKGVSVNKNYCNYCKRKRKPTEIGKVSALVCAHTKDLERQAAER